MAVRRKKFKLRFFAILLVPVFAVGAFLFYRMKNPTHGKLYTETVNGETELTAAIIRSESVTEATDYSAIHFLKKEGDLVSPGDTVAVLYLKGYDSQLETIVSEAQNIYTKQTALLKGGTGDLPAEVLSYNERIADTVESMTKAAMLQDGDYLALTDTLMEDLSSREAYLKSLLPAESNIEMEAKYKALEEAKQKLSSYTVYLTHETEAGYISFHLDGYETALDLSSLTATQIRQIVTSPISGTVNDNALYRVSDPYGFHLAFTVGATSPFRFVVGQSYDFHVKNSDTVYPAKIISEKNSGTYVLYVAEVSDTVQPVLEARTVQLSVSSTASGITIPVEGLYFNNGVPFIYVLTTGGTYEPIEVVILCANDEEAVIRAKNTEIQLREKLRFEYHEDEEDA